MYDFISLVYGGSPYTFTETIAAVPVAGQAVLDTSTGKYYCIVHEVCNMARTYIVYIYPNQ